MSLNPDPIHLDEDGFIAAFGGVYEHSAWIAKAVWDSNTCPPDTAADMAMSMAAELKKAGPDTKLALLRAHPDLAGKAAMADELTDESRSEQAGAGLDQCTPAQFERFARLNPAYTAKFGFPFIVAVKGMDRQQILDQFEKRLGNSAEEEFETALAQVNKIACLRLEAMED